MFLLLFLGSSAVGADLGEVVGAENANCVDDHSEGDHQVDGRCNELTSLEGDATDDHDGLGETLAAERSQERGDDTVREGGEEASNNASEVERSRKNNDVLGVEHFVCKDGEKTDPSNTFDDVSSTMDKYQRRQIARWEQKKAKDHRKFQEQMVKHARQVAWEKVYKTVEEYNPPLSIIFPHARSYAPLAGGLAWDFEDDDLPRLVLGIRFDFYEHMFNPYVDVNVEKEIESGIRRKNNASTIRLAVILSRHQQRVNIIREELVERTNRFRAIQTCRYGFKEELMMAAWHPRRLERILETYGWEAYDNLLGVE